MVKKNPVQLLSGLSPKEIVELSDTDLLLDYLLMMDIIDIIGPFLH